MSYNKNVNNQNGLSVDNITVNNTVSLPNITIDSTNGASFNSVINAKAGIQLPTTTYTINNYYLGYQPTPIYSANGIVVAPRDVAYVNLTPGTYILRGQIEYFNFKDTATLTYSSLCLSSVSVTINPLLSTLFRGFNGSMAVGDSFIQEVTGIVKISSTTNYYLVANLTYNNGSIIFRTTNSSTTAIVSTAQTSNVTCLITVDNSNILIGMNVTGTGISQPCYVWSNLSNTVTFTTTQTLSINTVLTFSHSNCASNLIAIRIA